MSHALKVAFVPALVALDRVISQAIYEGAPEGPGTFLALSTEGEEFEILTHNGRVVEPESLIGLYGPRACNLIHETDHALGYGELVWPAWMRSCKCAAHNDRIRSHKTTEVGK